jgi:hypothetical protein
MTVMLASMYRSTQFCMHGSSLRSSFPADIFEVTHLFFVLALFIANGNDIETDFLKHMSVREWTVACICCFWPANSMRVMANNVVYQSLPSCVMNWFNSCLSLSESFWRPCTVSGLRLSMVSSSLQYPFGEIFGPRKRL